MSSLTSKVANAKDASYMSPNSLTSKHEGPYGYGVPMHPAEPEIKFPMYVGSEPEPSLPEPEPVPPPKRPDIKKLLCMGLVIVAVGAVGGVCGAGICKPESKPTKRPTNAPTKAPTCDKAAPLTGLGTNPEYSGVIKITGTANFIFTGTAVTINYELTGIQPACETAGPEPNSCGIHIHSGTSCDTQAQQEGHYYNPAITDDPWKSIVYTTGTDTTGEVEYGYTAAETFGKVFIVHDYNGKRVTCIPVTSSCNTD